MEAPVSVPTLLSFSVLVVFVRGMHPANLSSDILMGEDGIVSCRHRYAHLCGLVFLDAESCGEELCTCCGRPQPSGAPRYAECLHHLGNLSYIPRLPDSVRYLDYSYNGVPSPILRQHFFSNATQITNLRFSYNGYDIISFDFGRDVFRGMRNLQCLEVDGYLGLTPGSLKTMLSVPGLHTFSEATGNLLSPPVSLFTDVTSDVHQVVMSYNTHTDLFDNSKSYDLSGFCSMPNLVHLELNYDEIRDLTTTCVLPVQHLELQNNAMESLTSTCRVENFLGEDLGSLFPNLTSLLSQNVSVSPSANLTGLFSSDSMKSLLGNLTNLLSAANLSSSSLSCTLSADNPSPAKSEDLLTPLLSNMTDVMSDDYPMYPTSNMTDAMSVDYPMYPSPNTTDAMSDDYSMYPTSNMTDSMSDDYPMYPTSNMTDAMSVDYPMYPTSNMTDSMSVDYPMYPSSNMTDAMSVDYPMYPSSNTTDARSEDNLIPLLRNLTYSSTDENPLTLLYNLTNHPAFATLKFLMPNLTRLMLAANRTSYFPNVTTLLLANNRMMTTGPACLPELKVLDLSYNRIPVAGLSIKQFPKLETLKMNYQTGTYLQVRNNTFQHPSLKHLEIDGWKMPFSDRNQVDSATFANCPRLTFLSAADNNFEHVDDARFLELFGSLPLEVLILSNNQLGSMSVTTFSHFSNLSRLGLAGTGISSVPDGAFDFLQRLTWLDISDNKITTVTEETFSTELRYQFRFLGLDKNPFLCSCELMWFRQWYVSDPRLFLKTNLSAMDYQCQNVPGARLADFSMTEQACVMSHAMNVMIVFTCTLAIVTLTIVSLVFRFRWNIRLALYEAFRGRSDVRKLRLLADHFDYDVFVSYAKEDLPWVYQRLMPELESRLGLRLCVHERDFIPGNNIVDNIVECVQSSKKILMVFSKDFVRSQWCQFELTFCMNHVMNFDDVLLIVCVDDVASRDMTAAMMAVLKTTTYIQWEDHGDAVDSFWGRLCLALHEITGQAEDMV